MLTTTWSVTDAAGHTKPLGVGVGDHVRTMLDPGTYQVRVQVFDGMEPSNTTITLTVTEHKLSTPGFDVAGASAGLVVAAVLLAGARRRNRKE